MSKPCRACRSRAGDLVLDLGDQPAAEHMPLQDDPEPDALYPLQLWLCASCGLAQLIEDAVVPEEPQGVEPASLAAQAVDAMARVSAAGLLRRGGGVAEYPSPHGEPWMNIAIRFGLSTVGDHQLADVVLDTFGLIHAPDQAGALAERTARVAPGGVLLLQYHALAAIIAHGQWNVLRHGHYAYHSTSALTELLAMNGFSAVRAWQFDLYGGTVLLAAARTEEGARPDASVSSLLRRDDEIGVRDINVLRSLQSRAEDHAARLHRWLVTEQTEGETVVGYGAASRAVPLLVRAGIDRVLLPAVVDASAAKQGCRMPGTDIPIVAPAQLAEYQPASVLLFVPDLLPEVRAALPWVEESGARWVDAMELGPVAAK